MQMPAQRVRWSNPAAEDRRQFYDLGDRAGLVAGEAGQFGPPRFVADDKGLGLCAVQEAQRDSGIGRVDQRALCPSTTSQ